MNPSHRVRGVICPYCQIHELSTPSQELAIPCERKEVSLMLSAYDFVLYYTHRAIYAYIRYSQFNILNS